MKRTLASALTALLWATQGVSVAADFPTRPITIIMSTAAGGTTDVFARVLATKMQERMGQPVLVVNKPGAGTAIGTEAIIQSAPDGYTIGYASTGGATYHLLNKNPKFVFASDTTPVIVAVESGFSLVANPKKVNVRDLREFISMVKAQPGKFNYATPGIATATHIITMIFEMRTGTNMTHVPYKESPRQTQALITGEVDLAFMSTAAAKPNVDTGAIRVLAVTSGNRDPVFPNAPTLREAGVDMAYTLWFGFVAPAKTPRDLIMRHNQEINAALKLPDVRQKFAGIGLTPVGGTPEDLAALIRGDMENIDKLIKAGVLKTE